MTKEVMVTIAGLQAIGEGSEDQDAIELVHIRGLEIRKRGPVAAHMIFEEGSSRQSIYQVPYGSFQVETSTTSVRVAEDEQGLEVLITYQLAVNGRHCADCDIRVFVQSREQFCLD